MLSLSLSRLVATAGAAWAPSAAVRPIEAGPLLSSFPSGVRLLSWTPDDELARRSRQSRNPASLKSLLANEVLRKYDAAASEAASSPVVEPDGSGTTGSKVPHCSWPPKSLQRLPAF